LKLNQFSKCLIILMVSFLSCSKEKSVATRQISNDGSNWFIFRGDQQLRGVANTILPDKLKLWWSFETGDDIKSSAVIDGKKIYIGSDDGFVYALNFATGELIWKLAAGSAVEAPPLYVDGGLFVGTQNGEFFAIDASSGKMRWQFKTEGQIKGSANWFTSEKNEIRIVVGSYDNFLYCLNAETGQKVWALETGNFINGAPAILNGKIVFGGCDALLHVLFAEQGNEVSTIEAGSYIAGSAALEDDRAFFGQYEAKFLSADLKLNNIIWEYGDPENGEAFFSSAAVTEDRILVGSRDYSLHCISKADGRKIWSFQTRDVVDSSPVICGDKVVFCSEDGRLYIVNLADGKLIWSYEIGSAIVGSPAVAAGKIAIGAQDGRLYVFGEA